MNEIRYKRLLEIIKEEIEACLSGINESNPYKNDKGHFTSEKDATIYSFTKRAPVSDELKQRGTYKNGKISSKFGANTGSPDKQCGRLTFGGEKKRKTRSCKDYPKRYGVKESELLDPEITEDSSNDAYIKSLIKSEIEKQLKLYQQRSKNKRCIPDIEDFIKVQAKLAQAQSTKQ